MKKLLYFSSLILALTACKSSVSPAIEKDAQIEAKVEKTLKSLSLEQKAGQMVQITLDVIYDQANNRVDMDRAKEVIGKYYVGSILNVPGNHAQTRETFNQIVKDLQEVSMEAIGVPCIYGLDMIHGATYLQGATFFPQEINLASSFNPEHARNMGEILAYETRAASTPWVFSPVMDLGRDPRWSRHWESWGEDPYLQTVMATTEVKAIQGDDPNHIDEYHAAACMKHYMAYGVPVTGKDRTPAVVTPTDLKEKFFPPFKGCAEEGVLSVMINSAAVNGVPTHANKELVQGWLKDGLAWDGMAVTDWADLDNLFNRDHVAVDKKDAIRIGINAGIDMIMDPYDVKACDLICELVREGGIPEARVDDAVRRVLRLKYRLGLFDNPVGKDYKELDKFASDEFVAKAKAAALESEVLLKNEGGILPLGKNTRILVTGPNANSMRSLNGGWSYTWQGQFNEAYTEQYNTIYEALSNKFQNVTFAQGVKYLDSANWWEEDASGIAAAVAAARNADVIVACVGENSYCETPGNMDDLTLSQNQRNLVKALAATGKPIVLVLNEGRPRIISEIEPLAKAVVDVMLPSNYGGDALAELLSGDANFSAKLPFTYPKYVHSLHTYDYKVCEHRETMEGAYNYDAIMDVQWPFGTGLSYTTYKYSNMSVNKAEFTADDVLEVKLTVTNTGSVAGTEPVLLYSSDLVASLIPDVRRLRAFTRVSLEPGQSKEVAFQVAAKDLAFVGQDMNWQLEKGEFRLSAGNQSVMINCTQDASWK